MTATASPVADRERLHRALTLALDPAAPEGEQVAAVRGVLRIARARGWRLPQLLEVLAPERVVHVESTPAHPWGWHVVLPFGKYRGWTVGEVAEMAPHYIAWCVDNVRRLDPDIRRAMTAVLTWFRNQGAQ